MSGYALALTALVLSHAIPSFPGVRPALIGKLGKPIYLTLYSLISLAILAAVVWTYTTAESTDFWFEPSPSSAIYLTALMPISIAFIVARLCRPFGPPDQPNQVKGIYRICRFPGSTGLLVWAGLHLSATGDDKRAALFFTMIVIAVYAIAKNQYVLARSEQPAAREFLNTTSILPFAGLLSAKTRWDWAEINYRIPLLTIAVYGAILAIHPILFGVDPLYWLD